MKAVLLGNHAPNSPEWDGLRAKGLGGSEIAAVVGLSPWESRFSLWHRKRGTLGKQTVNTGMDWGTRLEGVICRAWAERHGEGAEGWIPREAGSLRHHEREWQLANVDRLVYAYSNSVGKLHSILEAKTAHQYDAHEWGHGPEDIPPYYRCQVLWYLDVLELPLAHLAVLIGGSDYREYQIPYSKSEAEWLREQGAAFWQSVLSGDAPDIDGSTATYEAVRALHPEIDGSTVELDPALHDWFKTSRQAADHAAAEHTAAKATVLDAMGQAQYAEVNGQRAYRRQNARGGSVALYPTPPFRGEQTHEEKTA